MRSVELPVRFLKTLRAQVTKDISLLIKSWYFIILLSAALLILMDLLYTDSIGKQTGSTGLISFHMGLRSNILSITFSQSILNFENFIILMVPAILITDDIENRNFLILKTLNVNTAGYVAGKLLSSFIAVFLIILCLSITGEGYVFYKGYIITSGFLIDPLLVSMAIMGIFILPVTFALFLSSLLPNKVFSIISVFLIYPVSTEISSKISTVYGTSGLSFINMFIFSLSGFSRNLPAYLIHSSLYTSENYLPIENSIFIIEIMSIFFVLFTFISVFMRKNSVKIRIKTSNAFKMLLRRKLNEKE